jgi:hypothetical protein
MIVTIVLLTVFRIRNAVARIRIRGFVQMSYEFDFGSGSRSYSFLQLLSTRRQKNTIFAFFATYDTRQLVLAEPRHSVPGAESTCDEEQREWPGSGRPPDDTRQLGLPDPRHSVRYPVLKVPVMKSRDDGQGLTILQTKLNS